MRSLEDIRTTGAAWVTEAELAWLCDEILLLRVERDRLAARIKAASWCQECGIGQVRYETITHPLGRQVVVVGSSHHPVDGDDSDGSYAVPAVCGRCGAAWPCPEANDA